MGTITSVQDELNAKMEKTINVLIENLKTVRAGRANPAILDKVFVDYYGAPTSLKQLANVSSPEPRLIQVQPFDPTTLGNIERAINQADLGMNPSNDGKIIRIIVPPLTEERRKDLTKVARKIGEETKVALRNERRTANDVLKKLEKDKDITEDELKTALDDVQKTIDTYIKKTDEIISNKEKDILEV
ncbi:MAG: ribosome recycling factor [Peptostreptococcales bacterium]